MASYTKSYGRQIHFDIFELKKKKDYRNESVCWSANINQFQRDKSNNYFYSK